MIDSSCTSSIWNYSIKFSEDCICKLLSGITCTTRNQSVTEVTDNNDIDKTSSVSDTTFTASEGTEYLLTNVVADSITVASSNTTMIKDCSDCTCKEGINLYCVMGTKFIFEHCDTRLHNNNSIASSFYFGSAYAVDVFAVSIAITGAVYI